MEDDGEQHSAREPSTEMVLEGILRAMTPGERRPLTQNELKVLGRLACGELPIKRPEAVDDDRVDLETKPYAEWTEKEWEAYRLLVHGATTEEVEAITGLSLKEFTHNPGSVYHAMANIFARHGISYSFADFEREQRSALRDPAPPE